MRRVNAAALFVLIVNVPFVLLQKPPKGRQQPASDMSDIDAASYLRKFGYIDFQFDPAGDTHADMASAELFTNAIKNFQNFAKLPVTGELDRVTRETMQLPRCGLKDDPPDPDLVFGDAPSNTNEVPESRNSGVNKPHHRRPKRYASQGKKWPITNGQPVAYTVSDYTRHMQPGPVDVALAKAFDIWQSNAGITFQRVGAGDKADIVIRFAESSHGDNDPFDGPGGVLAHAYYPAYGGATHFDDAEKWGTTMEDSQRGAKSLVQVAVHELGHALGLAHSDNQKAIMAPFYRAFQANPELDDDDIQGIQFLYGPPSSRRKPTDVARPSTPPDRGVGPSTPPSGGGGALLDICREKLDGRRHKLDAITTTKDGSTYAFSGRYYWKIGDYGVESGYPRLISQDWAGLPDSLDTAVTWREEGRTYFFKGDQYWRFVNQRAEPGYPRRMSVGFPGIPTPIDAAYVWSGNGKLYFVKGRQYWQFITDGPENENPIPPGYPRPLSTWLGVPEPLDGAFEWRNGKTYFFSGSEYSGFDDKEFKVDEAKYPRDTLKFWFGCQSENLIYSDVSGAIDTGRPTAALVQAPHKTVARPAAAAVAGSSRKRHHYVPVIGPHEHFRKAAVPTQHATMRFVSRRKQLLQQQNDAAQSATEDPRRVKELVVPKSRQAHVNTRLAGARQV